MLSEARLKVGLAQATGLEELDVALDGAALLDAGLRGAELVHQPPLDDRDGAAVDLVLGLGGEGNVEVLGEGVADGLCVIVSLGVWAWYKGGVWLALRHVSKQESPKARTS